MKATRRKSTFEDSDEEAPPVDVMPALQEAEARAPEERAEGGPVTIIASRTVRDLSEIIPSDLPATAPHEQVIPEVQPLEHLYDDAVDEGANLKRRVGELEKKVGEIGVLQEGTESDLLDAASACHMILEGVLTERDFAEKSAEVEKVKRATFDQVEALQMSKAVRDREVKVVVFGPAPTETSIDPSALVAVLGGRPTKAAHSPENVAITHVAYKSVKFTFWDVHGDFGALTEAARARVLSLADALVVVVRAAAEPQEREAWRAALRAWLTADAGKAPLAVVVTGASDAGALDAEEVARELGLAHMWQRPWASFAVARERVAEDGLQALLWVYDAITDDAAWLRQAEFSLDSATRQSRLLAHLKDTLIPDIAAKYEASQRRLAELELQLSTLAAGGQVALALAPASPDRARDVAVDLGPLRFPEPTLPACDQRPKFGTAQEMLEHGGFYEGGFRYWRRDGHGVLVDKLRGEVFEGQFRSERAHGTGTKKWVDGSEYVGAWQNGLKHGTGRLLSADGRKFDGQWADGHRHGRGTQVFENRDRYTGTWREGQQHGRGKYFFYAEGGEWVLDELGYGAAFEGEWVRGSYHGAGLLTKPHQAPERLTYQHGVLLSRESVEGEQSRTDMHAHVQYPALEPTAFRVSETTRLGFPGAR